MTETNLPDGRWPDLRIAALIPAYRPPADLEDVVAGLVAAGCARIVVVDDGSGADSGEFFARVAAAPGVLLLRHPNNLGKGAALRTGITRLLSDAPDLDGVVTLDADGQHRPSDAVRVAASLGAAPESLVLGARTFADRTRIPWRSRFGNDLTRSLFRFVYGGGVEDTQTGLRGLPRSFMVTALGIRSNRYDYELDMLIRAVRENRPIVNLPIETVYIDGNRSSHFNPVVDSLRIYFSLFRFSISALTAVVLDFVVFYIALLLTANIATSLAAGRVLATAVNFLLNRRFVFRYRKNLAATLAKYLTLVVVLAVVSYALILAMTAHLGIPAYAAKVIAEGVLFIFSFLAQRHIVFAGRDDDR
ncbi:MAG: bifunctional glycosyltransferase family 2/GtrA family protein [Alphaproteobacteria bacterium]